MSARAKSPPPRRGPRRRRGAEPGLAPERQRVVQTRIRAGGISTVVLLGAMLLATAVGPVNISVGDVVGTIVAHLPFLDFHTSTPPVDQAIVWQLRLPRVVLAALVGAMLAAGGTSYQGVLRNSLADPFLLGVAAGAGLGATVAIVTG